MAESAEVKYWKDSYAQKAQEYNELQAIYKEFQQSSQDFEGELEVELAQAHAENERIRSKLAKAEAQMRKLREEMERSNSQSNNEIANLQKKVLSNGAQNDVERALLRLEQEKTDLDRRCVLDLLHAVVLQLCSRYSPLSILHVTSLALHATV